MTTRDASVVSSSLYGSGARRPNMHVSARDFKVHGCLNKYGRKMIV